MSLYLSKADAPSEREPSSLRQLSGAAATSTALSSLRRVLGQGGIGFDLLRIYLGLGLAVRGALLIESPRILQSVLSDDNGWLLPIIGTHVLVLTHLVGGTLLMAGCLTRLAAAIQVPVLAGAVFIVHMNEGLFSRGQSLELSALVLLMLVLYALFGGGPLSVDAYFRERVRGSDAAPESERPPASAQAAPASARVPTSVRSYAAPEPPISTRTAAGSRQADSAREGASAWVHSERNLKQELPYVLLFLVAFMLLLAGQFYMYGGLWLAVWFITFCVWRTGRAPST
jgi:putative oxidoreductase